MEAQSQSSQPGEMNFNLNAFSWKSVELTATRCAFTLSMIKTLSLRATLALGGGSSLLAR